MIHKYVDAYYKDKLNNMKMGDNDILVTISYEIYFFKLVLENYVFVDN